jgi:hypothetical protein
LRPGRVSLPSDWYDNGQPVSEVDGFLRLLTVREYSPNTVRAYARPCECDLYLTCAKFVTTPQYAPRLRERLKIERQLASDAEEHGWDREVDRHQRIADRIICLLGELGEPRDTPDDET